MQSFCKSAKYYVALIVFIAVAAPAAAQTTDYTQYAIDYADAMINYGRDTYGSVQSPLFASAMKRGTPTTNPELLATNWNERVSMERTYGGASKRLEGIRMGDRCISGGNVAHDEGLYKLLYGLAGITGNGTYAQQANNALGWWLSNAQESTTNLMMWGEHTGWDFYNDRRIIQYQFNYDGIGDNEDVPLWPTQGWNSSGDHYDPAAKFRHNADGFHEFYDNWTLWDECLAVNDTVVRDYATGLWNHQIHNQSTGAFDRHAMIDNTDWEDWGNEFPRHGGFYIETWARSYASTSDSGFRSEMIDAIETLVDSFENRRNVAGFVPAGGSSMDTYWGTSTLELAIQSHTASLVIDDPTTIAKLRQLAQHIDQDYHNASTEDQDFGHAQWAKGYGQETDANTALFCLERYHQLDSSDPNKQAYLNLALAAADGYLTSNPLDAVGDTENTEDDDDNNVPDYTDGTIYHLYPGALADAIDLMLEAFALTGDQTYLDRAEYFGDEAITLFFDGDSALPKASQRSDHYESVTGGADLMLSLVALDQTIHMPEPASMSLMALGGLALLRRRKRK
jgi:hypothetical protein